MLELETLSTAKRGLDASIERLDASLLAVEAARSEIDAARERVDGAIFEVSGDRNRFLATKFGYGGVDAPVFRDAPLAPRVTIQDALSFYTGIWSKARSAAYAVADEYMIDGVRFRLSNACGDYTFEERLVQFWDDHFTTVAGGRGFLPMQESKTETVRQHVFGNFADMLTAVELHPMMVLYLDQNTSAGDNSELAVKLGEPKLNENLGRELLELHTVGVDAAYTQDDVREAANMLTGVRFGVWKGVFYDRTWAEPGTETILGVDYPEDSMEEVHRMLRDLAMNKQTAWHLARKLAVHFVSDQPEPALVDRMAETYLRHNGSLMPVYIEMFAARETVRAGLTKVRQPIDWVGFCFRAVGLTPEEVMSIPSADFRLLVERQIAKMGQDRPTGPNGWDEAGDAWVQPQTLPVRLSWARNVLPQILDLIGKPVPELNTVLANIFGTKVPEHIALWAPRAQDNLMAIAAVLASAEAQRR